MKTLKDLLKKEPRVTGRESTIQIESIRKPFGVRADDRPDDGPLARSIATDGLRHPIAVWTDGTLVSGARRLRVLMAAGEPTVRAVFVDTIEDAAKRMLMDNGDEAESVPFKPSEMCRWWDLMRKLDEPAAIRRLDAARRQGVQLRKQTQSGQREPGRSRNRGKGEEYLLSVLGEPFGMKEATASRLYAVHKIAVNESLTDERRKMAADALGMLDRGETSIWRAYASLLEGRRPVVAQPRATPATEPAPAAKQRAAWDRALPQLEGLVAGLTELGPPHPDLDWAAVGPVHARLMKIRRDLEKIITKQRETAQS